MKKDKGKIITITSCKGGVGKTITTLNLAGVYKNLGKKVLILDFDIYGGSIATYLDSKNDRTLFNLIEDFSHNRYENIDDYIYKYDDLISIIAAPKDPRHANKIDTKYIPIVLDTVVYKYDVILVDTTHILNNINIITMDNSDKILYLFTNDTFDLKNTRSFMNIMKDVGFTNIYTVLNNSICTSNTYFSNFDIRNIIKHNIDFSLSKNLYIKNIDKYIMDSEILTLNKDLKLNKTSDYKTLTSIANTLIELEVK